MEFRPKERHTLAETRTHVHEKKTSSPTFIQATAMACGFCNHEPDYTIARIIRQLVHPVSLSARALISGAFFHDGALLLLRLPICGIEGNLVTFAHDRTTNVGKTDLFVN